MDSGLTESSPSAPDTKRLQASSGASGKPARRSPRRRAKGAALIVVVIAVLAAVTLYTLERPAGTAPPWKGTTSITFSCSHALVSMNTPTRGVVLVCDNSSSSVKNTTTLLSCTAAACTGSVTFGVFNGYFFSNWTASGDVYFGGGGSGCSSSQSAGSQQGVGGWWTVCMKVSPGLDQQSGSVMVNLV